MEMGMQLLVAAFVANLALVLHKLVTTSSENEKENLQITSDLSVPVRAVGALILMVFSFARSQATGSRLLSVLVLTSYNLSRLYIIYEGEMTTKPFAKPKTKATEDSADWHFYTVNGICFVLLLLLAGSARLLQMRFFPTGEQKGKSSAESDKDSFEELLARYEKMSQQDQKQQTKRREKRSDKDESQNEQEKEKESNETSAGKEERKKNTDFNGTQSRRDSSPIESD